ncbi:hypothetical protein [Spirosoma endophyticum]|uniref:Dolichyl-phosphate-mannose-protein mannosyltransferase n=1 Tax=Spirosoma endophyticum TaxID=662367 RepID=A0A1I2A3I5_9BACT|nr:hypothetical protein [Spirosoma endophyticum]SFE38521.1 hypothetical protein SAMN05216167_11367 [Spirosoma endophyticum]
MLRFFQSYFPYQYASLLGLLLLIRLPLLLHPFPLLIPELNWMIVGEQMSQGNLLYRDIWDSVSPLSAMVYWGIDSVFGRSPLVLHGAATLVSVFQIVYFNYLTNNRDIYPDRTFWPGLIYMLFMHLSFDCLTLSPVLMSTSFLLLAFGTLIRQMDRRGATDEVFEVGFYIGIAALFYLPSALFILWSIVSLLFYTGSTFRQYSLSVFGFLFPFAATVLFYYLFDGLNDFNRNLLASVFRVRQYSLSDFQSLLASLLIPLGLGVLGFLSLFSRAGRYVNFQQRIQQIMAIWFVVAVLTIALMPFLAPMAFLSFVPPMAYFAYYYFENIRKVWLAEMSFSIAFVLILLLFYQGALGIIPGAELGRLSSLQVRSSPLPADIRDQHVLIIGEDLSAYRQNHLATPYLNWDLAKYDLKNLDNYEAVINVFDHFRLDPPDYIIDRENVVEKLFQRAPALAARYEKTAVADVYKRKN